MKAFHHLPHHDDVIKWKHFPRYWPFVVGIHRSPVNSSNKGQWRGALLFSLICARTNGWVNSRDAGDLMRHRSQYDVTVMIQVLNRLLIINLLRLCNAICVSELCDCYSKLLFVAWLVLSPLLNRYWLLPNCTLRNKLHRHFKHHANILFKKCI